MEDILKTKTYIERYKNLTSFLLISKRDHGLFLGEVGFLETYRAFEAILNLVILELSLTPDFIKKFINHCLKEDSHLKPRQTKELLRSIAEKFSNIGGKLEVSQFNLALEMFLKLELNVKQKMSVCEKVFDFTKLEKDQQQKLKSYSILRNNLIHAAGLISNIISENFLEEFILFCNDIVNQIEQDFNNQIKNYLTEINDLKEKLFFGSLDHMIVTGFAEPTDFEKSLSQLLLESKIGFGKR